MRVLKRNGTYQNVEFDKITRRLQSLCKQINNQIPDVTFHGHCEVAPKLCPVFDYQEVLDLDELGKMLDENVESNRHKKVEAQAKFIEVFEELMDISRRLEDLMRVSQELGDMIDEL